MMISPPESARARLLKLRRVHRTEGRKKLERETDLAAAGNAESCDEWIISPDADLAGCVPVRDRAVISIAIVDHSSFEPAVKRPEANVRT